MDNVEGAAKRVNYESRVLEALSKFPKASAAEIARMLHPDELEIKKRTSQVSVALKRLESKGIVKNIGKVGRSVFFSLPDKVIDEQTSRFVEETEQKMPPIPADKAVPGSEIEVRKREVKETVYVVKVKKPEKPPKGTGIEERVLECLEKAKEASASEIAVILFPPEEKVRRTPEVSVYLKRLQVKGKVEPIGKSWKKLLYRIKGAEPVERKEVPYGIENELLQILKNINEVSASEAAEKLYPTAEEPKGKTSQMYVSLRRLEDKGLVAETERRDGKVYFALETRSRLQKAMELPRFEIPKFELPRMPSIPHVPPIYSAVGLTAVAVALIFYNFSGGMGFFAFQDRSLSFPLTNSRPTVCRASCTGSRT